MIYSVDEPVADVKRRAAEPKGTELKSRWTATAGGAVKGLHRGDDCTNDSNTSLWPPCLRLGTDGVSGVTDSEVSADGTGANACGIITGAVDGATN